MNLHHDIWRSPGPPPVGYRWCAFCVAWVKDER